MNNELQKNQTKEGEIEKTSRLDLFKETYLKSSIAINMIKSGNQQFLDRTLTHFFFYLQQSKIQFDYFDPASVITAFERSCQIKLAPDKVNACLVSFFNKSINKHCLTFLPMYQGLLEVAYRSNRIKSISVDVVKEGDFFEYNLGTDPFIRHQINLEVDRPKAKFLAVYACAELMTGGRNLVVLPFSEIERIKEKKESNFWREWYDEMAKKTAIRRLYKMLSKDQHMQLAMEIEREADEAIDRNNEAEKKPNIFL